MVKYYPFCRVFYERGTGNAVIDSGPDTERLEVKHIRLDGKFQSSHADGPPKFWLAGEQVWVRVMDGVAYVSTM